MIGDMRRRCEDRFCHSKSDIAGTDQEKECIAVRKTF